MKIYEIINHLESIAPLSIQENYDNSGLIVGDKSKEVNAALISLDCTEEVVEEAINENCELIIAHHPIVFEGLKKITGSNYIERTILKAIKNNIAIYAIHTNLDNVKEGVNGAIANKIGLVDTKILRPKSSNIKKLVVCCPLDSEQKLKDKLWEAGAGNIGNYSKCSFRSKGIGTFKGNNESNPSIGTKNTLHSENEIKIEMIFPTYLEHKILSTLFVAHPYEEVSYEVYTLENKNQNIGSGIYGKLSKPMTSKAFLKFVKNEMKTDCIRHTEVCKENIQTVAICGGSGSFLLDDAKRIGADIFISSDFKYHQFFDADKEIIIADIGHYESEQFTKELISDILKKKFTKFATRLSSVNTNPINYLK
jgi:dinuclear metal center YbgI/SA1388 family protein